MTDPQLVCISIEAVEPTVPVKVAFTIRSVVLTRVNELIVLLKSAGAIAKLQSKLLPCTEKSVGIPGSAPIGVTLTTVGP